MRTAANAGNKTAASAALARVKRAVANRKALEGAGVPVHANIAGLVTAATNNHARATVVANAAAALAKAEARAAAAAKAAANAQTAAAARAARNELARATKAAANAAKAAEAASAAKQKQIRDFVLKVWKLTPGTTNSQTKLWAPRIQNNAALTRELQKFKGALTEANINAIKTNINSAAANKKIGYWGGPFAGKNANMNNKIEQAKWIVNLGLGRAARPAPWQLAKAQSNAVTKIAARWRGRKARGAFYNAATEASKAVVAARAAAAIPGGPTKSKQLAKQFRLAKIGQNLKNTFINGPGQINKPDNLNKINKTFLQNLTNQEIVNHLKGINGFKPTNAKGFTNANLVKMARYFTA